jgi:3-oxoacyl-[acyl-carrier protein] reductase
MDLGLSGRLAVVTGGSKGLGQAIAAELIAEGAAVTICARNSAGASIDVGGGMGKSL